MIAFIMSHPLEHASARQGLPTTTETIFGKNQFDVNFEILLQLMSHLLKCVCVRAGGGVLRPILQPAMRGHLRCFGFALGRSHDVYFHSAVSGPCSLHVRIR